MTDQTAAATPADPINDAAVNQLHAEIKANFDNKVDVKAVKFHFKKVELTAKDASGKEVKTGETNKRPTVELALPTPSVEGIIEILQKGGKGLELLLEAVQDVVISQAREIVNADEAIKQETFDLNKVSWETIANLPKGERRGGGIAKETWADFAEDYIKVMPAVTGKPLEHIENATKIYLTKFQTCKDRKNVLTKLKEQLALYLENSPEAENYTECVSFLVNKADEFLKLDPEAYLNNL